MGHFPAWLLETSWQGGVLVLLVLALRWALGDRLPARWRSALWLVVLARLVWPVSVESGVSVYNLAPELPRGAVALVLGVNGPGLPERAQSPITGAVREGPSPALSQSTDSAQANSGANASAAARAGGASGWGAEQARAWVEHRRTWGAWVMAFWGAGAVAVLVALAFTAGRVLEVLRGAVPLVRPDLDEEIVRCRRALGLVGSVELAESARFAAPVVVGWWRPKLVLPEGLAAGLSAAEFRGVVLHELAHVKRGDVAWSWLAAAVLVVHWFNPLVWVAVWAMRRDRELACDQIALEAMPRESWADYGRTLLKLTAGGGAGAVLPGVAAVVEDHGDTHRRITMIARFRPAGGVVQACSAALIGVLALVSLTEAQPEAGKARPNPDRFGFYIKPYKPDEQGIVRLNEGVSWHVQARYIGVDEAGKQSVDDRLTVVIQDPAKQFWPVIMKLDDESAWRFKDDLARAVKNREADLAAGLKGLVAEPKGLEVTLGVERLEPDAQGMSPHTRGRWFIHPSDPNLPHLPVELTWYMQTVHSPETNVGCVRMSAATGRELLAKIDRAMAERLVAAERTKARAEGTGAGVGAGAGAGVGAGVGAGEPGQADGQGRAAAPGAARGSTIGLFTKGLKLNEFGAGDTTGAMALRAYAFYRGSDDQGVTVIDNRLTVVLDHAAERMWRVVARLSDEAAATLRDELAATIEARRAAKKTDARKPGEADQSKIILATKPYTLNAHGAVDLPADVQFKVLPGYRGVGRDGQQIVDERVTIVLQDEANRFWPMVAIIDDVAAENFLATLKASISARANKQLPPEVLRQGR
jgi:beta-lactamase regulating signal transducer with metallopeptidase domain